MNHTWQEKHTPDHYPTDWLLRDDGYRISRDRFQGDLDLTLQDIGIPSKADASNQQLAEAQRQTTTYYNALIARGHLEFTGIIPPHNNPAMQPEPTTIIATSALQQLKKHLRDLEDFLDSWYTQGIDQLRSAQSTLDSLIDTRDTPDSASNSAPGDVAARDTLF